MAANPLALHSIGDVDRVTIHIGLYVRHQAAALSARKLWYGFEETALAELSDMGTDRFPTACRVVALTEIARWHGAHAAIDRAVDAIENVLDICDDDHLPDEIRAIAIDLLIQAGRIERAIVLLDGASKNFQAQPDNALRRFNVLTASGATDPHVQRRALEWLNSVFDRRELAPISMVNQSSGLRIDNLRGTSPPASKRPKRLVTVVMPVWNAAATIGYALGGVLEQTWEELEVIVVDDGCSDETPAIARSIGDPRIRVVQNVRRGNYAARNLGMSLARGEFITVHDADDWSHPEKIEKQVTPLLDNDSYIATLSAEARTRAALHFVEPSLIPRDRKIGPNYSSFLMRRIAFDALGVWDEATVGADAEMIARCRRFYGERAVQTVFGDVPLSFLLRGKSSLTTGASVGTGALSQHHCAGARRVQRIHWEHWHRRSGFVASLPLPPAANEPLLVRPAPVDPNRRSSRRIDIVMMDDFAMDGDNLHSRVQEIRAHMAAGMRTGLIHVPVSDLDRPLRHHESLYGWHPLRRIDDSVLDLVDGDRVQLLTAGEAIDARVLIVRSPRVLMEPVAGLPNVESEGTVVVANEAPHKFLGTTQPVNYEVGRCTATLQAMGHEHPVWHPTNGQIRSALAALHSSKQTLEVALADDDWNAIRDREAWSMHILRINQIRGATSDHHREATP